MNALPSSEELEFDLLIVGSGTGLAAALSAHEKGARVLIVEKTRLVGGSTARSGGAFWIPANPVLAEQKSGDTKERAAEYLASAVGTTSPRVRWQSFVDNGSETVRMLQRSTRMKFSWAKGYSDYHPELPGGSATGRSCECRPFNAAALGAQRQILRPATMAAPIPMPVTGADYKWLNLMAKMPFKGLPIAALRAFQGIGGKALGREYVAGGQALAAGLFDAVRRAGIPLWTETALESLTTDDEGRVTGAALLRGGRTILVKARRGVVLAAGGFDHDLTWRRREQSEALGDWTLGSEGNTGDAIRAAQEVGAAVSLLDQVWWFPAVAPLKGQRPAVMLAERSLPGCFMIDNNGRRFINESEDYMSFGQHVLARERAGAPVGTMWLVFDKTYRNSYLLAGSIFPRMPLPTVWYEEGIAVQGNSWQELARKMKVPENTFFQTAARFSEMATAGVDADFNRGASAYDRYYGDPTITPNPNLRPLDPKCLYAVRVVLSDLGTCGGVTADEHARVLTENGEPIPGLYAVGNTAANAFGKSYPGAGATIGQGLVFSHVAAQHALNHTDHSTPVPSQKA
jgi:3-oxosteroid 1-dehydrogenase